MKRATAAFDQTKSPTPDPEMLITHLETLKLISDPLRLQLLEVFAKACTVKEASKALGIPATKLYYHVGQLEEHGILRVTDTRVVSGIIEKQYQVSAKSFKIDRSLLRVGADDTDGLLEVFGGLMDSVSLDIQQGVRSGLIETSQGQPKFRRLMFGRTLFKLTPTEADHLIEELEELLKKYDQENKNPAAVSFSLLIAFHLHSSPKSQTRKTKDKGAKHD